MLSPGLIEALGQIMAGLKSIGDGVNLSYRLHLKHPRRLSISTNDTDGNNFDSSRSCLEDRLQTHQQHILVLHRSTGNELPRRRLKRHRTLTIIEIVQNNKGI